MKNLTDLLFRGSETRGFDYKKAESWDSCKFGLVKDILAMSNTQDGGTIVLGVSQNDVTGQFEYLGFQDDEQLKDYDVTKVSDFTNTFANPEVNIEIFADEYENKKYIFIIVKEFKNIPIICKKNSSNNSELKNGCVYIRTDSAKSIPITSQGIESVTEMRKLLDLAITKQKEELLENIRRIVGTEPKYAVSAEQLYQKEKQIVEKEF